MGLAAGLEQFLKADQVVLDPSVLESHGRDWTREHSPNPIAVLFPSSKHDVQNIVKWARKTKTPLVPSGGRTGLAAGAVANQGEVVVSFDRMNKILEWNETDRTLRCEPGVVTETLQTYVEDRGYYFPVDLASRGSSQIGGNISTNAGGTKVIRYGHTRQWVSGLEVVTGTGELLQMSQSLIKNNAGYDLMHLFISAEGTLGFIVEATVRVVPPPKNLKVLLVRGQRLEQAIEILKRFQKTLSLTAYEFFTHAALEKVIAAKSVTSPFSESSLIYFLIEFECASDADLDHAIDAFEECKRDGLADEGLIAQNDRQASDFWALRENISESLAPLKPYKNDIAVKISRIPEFVAEAESTLGQKYRDCELIWFGHIGDGNLHINVLRGSKTSPEEFKKQTAALTTDLSLLLQKFNGSISAEHGIGLIKKPYFKFTRTPLEITAMKAIKHIFDPDHIMNPGKIFD